MRFHRTIWQRTNNENIFLSKGTCYKNVSAHFYFNHMEWKFKNLFFTRQKLTLLLLEIDSDFPFLFFLFLWFQIILTKSNSIGQKRSIQTVQFHAYNARKVMEFTTLAVFMMIIVMDSFPNGFRMYNLKTGVETIKIIWRRQLEVWTLVPIIYKVLFVKIVPKTLSPCYFFLVKRTKLGFRIFDQWPSNLPPSWF